MEFNSIKINQVLTELNKLPENILLKEIKVFKSKEVVVIDIFSNENISSKDLEKIQKAFQNKIELLKVKVNVMENEDLLNENELREFISKEFKIQEFNFYLKVNKNKVNVDFYVDIENEKLKDLKNECDKYNLELLIGQNGESSDIDSYIEKIENEENKIYKKIQAENGTRTINKTIPKVETENALTYKKRPKTELEITPLKEMSIEFNRIRVLGVVFDVDYKLIKNGETALFKIHFSDETDSAYSLLFLKPEKAEEYKKSIKKGMGIEIIGQVQFDKYTNNDFIKPTFFQAYNIEIRKDTAKEKRVELHLHTNMSALDGISSPEDLIKRAKYWGHKAVAITDHGVAQSFPKAMEIGGENDIKIIYGSEIYLVDDREDIIKNKEFITKETDSFVVFDLETTGFSARNDKIIEIGAVKIKNGEFVSDYNVLINPERSIPEEVVNLTGIDDGMLVGKPKFEDIKDEFYEFIGDSILVAHNAVFDMGFLKNNFEKFGYNFDFPYIDTLELSRIFYPTRRSHSLGKMAKYLGVSLENAHRAVDDAKATAEIFLKLLGDRFVYNDFSQTINNISDVIEIREKHFGKPYHAVVLVKNLIGLKNLYKLISLSHLDYFRYKPRIPKSVLDEYREGLIVSSACQDGELQKGIINNINEKNLLEIAKYYDYLEIQPIENNKNLIPEYFSDIDDLISLNKKVLEIGDKLDKLVVATGDVHYLDSNLKKTRKILSIQGARRFDEYDNDYSFKTTNEMLDEFSYLGPRAKEVVVDNSNKIADMIEDIDPIPGETYPPIIKGSDEMLTNMTMKKAHEIYGEKLPDIVSNRIKKELGSIIENKYSVLYIIAQKLVKKSNDDGYLVGSRGSVGSSLVATLCGITEVNPLPPHYSCPKCKYYEFINSVEMDIYSGVDLPNKKCPKCNTELNKLGDEIPFEVFLGFDGDKEPDIDLNFASEYQSNAHKYTEELFGEGNVFRAGTIGTIAEKTAFKYVKDYIEDTEINISDAEQLRLAQSMIGIKNTTGQHPGGIMIVPDYKDIFDFTPIQNPGSDNLKKEIITTHYEYKSISKNILKLDILGHDAPSMAKMIEINTGKPFMETPLNDKKVISLFNSNNAFEFNKEIYNNEVLTLGVPEFGTDFVMRMLIATRPTTFAELVQISGLSHGTNVWSGNAEELVKNGQANLKEVISTREDIMQDLINAGGEKKFSFEIMERVRKGRGLKPEQEEIISKFDLPNWYIDSLNKISYMFPKAHAVAYVSMSVRLAYYKVYHPELFYATFLSTKISDFDYDTIVGGYERIKYRMNEMKSPDYEKSQKDESLIPIYEIALEMYSRGIKMKRVDLYKSEASKFSVIDNEIIPPFTVIPNLGLSVAEAIVEERNKNKFLSIEDLKDRTKLSKTCIEFLKSSGTLAGLSDTNQLSLF